MKDKMNVTGIGKPGADADGAFRDSATAEELALARALDACEVPPVPKGAVMAIHLRVQAEAAARRRAWRRVWGAVWAVAAAVALLLGVWGVYRQGGGGAVVAEADTAEAADDAEAAEYAQEEEEWLSPYDEQFEALETTLLAFESMDFATEDSVFPSL
jgi:hypothetical protein